MISRRSLLAGAAATTALAFPGLMFAAANTDRRLVVIILRGAMDGLNVVVPYADPGYAAARRHLAVDVAACTTRLDGTFALNPALAELHALFGKHEALFVHAVASPYRERSHFDGQKVLECGGNLKPNPDGWLNRLLPMIGDGSAIALAPAVPLILQGPSPVASYSPLHGPELDEELFEAVRELYADDELLAPLWESAIAIRHSAGDADGFKRDLAQLAAVTARLLVQPQGPRIAVLESDGWDTHTDQSRRLVRKLGELDAAVAALRQGVGPHWSQLAIVAVTEFGRTVFINGTGGTDHGTASATILAGGAIAGGRVLADWPGLSGSALLDGRDLRPTTDIRALLTSLLAGHFRLDPVEVATRLFPELGSARFQPTLVR